MVDIFIIKNKYLYNVANLYKNGQYFMTYVIDNGTDNIVFLSRL